MRNPDCVPAVATAYQYANTVTDDVFNCQAGDGRMGNAFHHAWVNCFTAAKCGSSFAKKFWDAHEDSSGTNQCHHMQMDYLNNAVGRAVAIPGRPEFCRQQVRQALLDGRLRWMDDPTNQCTPKFEKHVPPDSGCVK